MGYFACAQYDVKTQVGYFACAQYDVKLRDKNFLKFIKIDGKTLAIERKLCYTMRG